MCNSLHEYSKPIKPVCKHIETEFVLIPVEMALCRKFRIIGEVPAK